MRGEGPGPEPGDGWDNGTFTDPRQVCMYVCTYLHVSVCVSYSSWPSRPNSMVCFNDACDGFIVDGK